MYQVLHMYLEFNALVTVEMTLYLKLMLALLYDAHVLFKGMNISLT